LSVLYAWSHTISLTCVHTVHKSTVFSVFAHILTNTTFVHLATTILLILLTAQGLLMKLKKKSNNLTLKNLKIHSIKTVYCVDNTPYRLSITVKHALLTFALIVASFPKRLNLI